MNTENRDNKADKDIVITLRITLEYDGKRFAHLVKEIQHGEYQRY